MALEFLKKQSQNIVQSNLTQQNLYRLAEKRQWASVVKLIPSNIDKLRPPDHNDSFLHHACKHQPPIQVIKEIVNVAPDLATLINFDGHSPLHISAQHGAPPEVICFLCLSYPDTSEFQDVNGKTPLHLACESYVRNYAKSRKNTSRRTAQEALLLTVKVLIKTSPTTVNLEDMDDMSAAEYVLAGDGDIDLNVLRVIQRASVTEWERRRALGEKLAKCLARQQYEEERSSFQEQLQKQKDKDTQQKNSAMAISA